MPFFGKKQNYPRTYAELKACADMGMGEIETSIRTDMRIGLVRKWCELYPELKGLNGLSSESLSR